MRIYYWPVALASVLVLAGCGGHNTTSSVFAGNYSGTFSGVDNSDAGTVAANIKDSGGMLFSVADTSANLALNGSIGDSGAFTARTKLNGFTITCNGNWLSQSFSLSSTNGVSHEYVFQVDSSGVKAVETGSTKPTDRLTSLGERP